MIDGDTLLARLKGLAYLMVDLMVDTTAPAFLIGMVMAYTFTSGRLPVVYPAASFAWMVALLLVHGVMEIRGWKDDG